MEASVTNKQLAPVEPALRLVFWEMTARCNLECVHCRRLDVHDPAAKDEFSPEAAIRFVDQIAECGNPILVFSGGEPLLRPDLFDLARRGLDQGLIVSLASNGTLIDAQMATRIHESGFHRVAVSIDGADEKTHDDFRNQPGSLRLALQGIRHMRDRGTRVQINCTITRNNWLQRDRIYELAIQEGADALHLFMLVPVGCGMSIANDQRLNPDEVERVLEWLEQKAATDDRMHLKATCAPQYYRIRLQKDQERKERGEAPVHARGSGHPGGHPGGMPKGKGGHPGGMPVPPQANQAMNAMTRGCLAGSGVCFVSHRGEVYPCGYMPLLAGNVHEKTLREIWTTSPELNQFRDPRQLEGKCGDCGYRAVCMGCRARAFYSAGSALAGDDSCAYVPPLHLRKAMASEDAERVPGDAQHV